MTDSVLTELRSKSLNPELHVYTEIPKNGRPCLKHHLNHNWWVYVLNSNSAFPHFLSLSSCSNHGCSYETWLKFHKMRLTCVQVIPGRGKHKTSALNAIFGSYDVIERIADTHLGGGGQRWLDTPRPHVRIILNCESCKATLGEPENKKHVQSSAHVTTDNLDLNTNRAVKQHSHSENYCRRHL